MFRYKDDLVARLILDDLNSKVALVGIDGQNIRSLITTLRDDLDIAEEEELREKKVKELVNEMIENSSLHGLNYIFNRRFTVRRVFWFFVTVVAFGIAVQKVYESTVNYLSYPFITVRTRRYVDELAFPSVSFCNINDMRMSTLRGSLVDEAIKLQDPYILANDSEANWKLTKKAAHLKEEMILQCSYNGIPCSHKNFSEFYWMQGERCYTFNDGKSGMDILKTRTPGRRGSLELTIDIQHYDYYRDRSKAGIHLILHDQDETPVRIEGPRISPGFSTHVQLKGQKYINLPAPYATRCGTKELTFFDAYSRNLCWLDSVTKHVEATCGCKDYFMPGDHIPVCGIAKFMNCTWPHWEHHNDVKAFDCPLPCEVYKYGHKLSRSTYPSKSHVRYLMEKFPVLRDAHENSTGRTRDAKEFLRDTLVRLVVYYDDLSYELIQQKPSYDTLVWLGDVGGTIGLFVGAGVMTYFEFIDCLMMVVHTLFFEKIDKQKSMSKQNLTG